MTKHASRALFRSLLIALLVVSARAAEPLSWEGTFTLSIRLGDAQPVPVGTEHQRYFATEYSGQPAQGLEITSEFVLNALGAQATVRQHTTAYLTLSHVPLRMETEMGTDEKPQKVVADFYPDRVDYERDAAGEVQKGSVPIPAGVSLRDPEVMWDPAAGTVGEEVVGWGFEPMTLQLEKVKLVLAGREPVVVGGHEVQAWRMELDTEMSGPQTRWVDDKGVYLRHEYRIGEITFVLERAETPPGESRPPTESTAIPDIIGGTAVDAGREIPKPRECRMMRVRVGGLDRRSLFISDQRQRYGELEELQDGSLEAELTVRTEQVAEHGPRMGDPVPQELMRFTEPTATIESNDPEIVKTARAIVGDETDSLAAARKIAEWVSDHMTPDLSEPMLRSAREVLDEPKGACRSYATLYCALARAVGIPCRLTVGAVYAGDAGLARLKGRFAFHAWDEVWVGSWLAVDTALPSSDGLIPVDATHIKFSSGDVASFAPVGRVIRDLRLEVIETDTVKERQEARAGLQGEPRRELLACALEW